MRLVENIPWNENFKVFFDNYVTSIALFLQLKAIGMYSLGVAKSNRMAGVILKLKSSMQKEGRGFMDRRITKSGEVVVLRCTTTIPSMLAQHLLVLVRRIFLIDGTPKKIHLAMLIEQRLSKSTMTSWVEWARWTFSSPSTLWSFERKDSQQESFFI